MFLIATVWERLTHHRSIVTQVFRKIREQLCLPIIGVGYNKMAE